MRILPEVGGYPEWLGRADQPVECRLARRLHLSQYRYRLVVPDEEAEPEPRIPERPDGGRSLGASRIRPYRARPRMGGIPQEYADAALYLHPREAVGGIGEVAYLGNPVVAQHPFPERVQSLPARVPPRGHYPGYRPRGAGFRRFEEHLVNRGRPVRGAVAVHHLVRGVACDRVEPHAGARARIREPFGGVRASVPWADHAVRPVVVGHSSRDAAPACDLFPFRPMAFIVKTEQGLRHHCGLVMAAEGCHALEPVHLPEVPGHYAGDAREAVLVGGRARGGLAVLRIGKQHVYARY